MTVKKIVNALTDAKRIDLAFNGIAQQIDKDNFFMMQAFGDCVVSEITCDNHEYELVLSMRPVKEGEQ